MAANVWVHTVEVTANWQTITDTPLVVRAHIFVWSSGPSSTPLDIRAGATTAQLPGNRDFVLDGVDLSQIEVKGETAHRVTVIAHSRQEA